MANTLVPEEVELQVVGQPMKPPTLRKFRGSMPMFLFHLLQHTTVRAVNWSAMHGFTLD